MKTTSAASIPVDQNDRSESPGSVYRPRPEPDVEPLRTTGLGASGFISGFGTLMEMENDLLVLLRQCLQGEPVVGRSSLARILGHHLQQVERIIRLCTEQQRTLPLPHRFRVIGPGPSVIQWEEVDPAYEPPGLLTDLLERNLELADGWQRLAACGRAAASPHASLSEASQRHQNLAWMLTALLHESDSEGPSQSLSFVADAVVGQGPERGEGRWENEGGALRRDAAETAARSPDHSVALAP